MKENIVPARQWANIKEMLLARLTWGEGLAFMEAFNEAKRAGHLTHGSFYRVLNGDSRLYKICRWIEANSFGKLSLEEMITNGFCEDIGVAA